MIYAYILQCSDGSYYVGSTSNLNLSLPLLDRLTKDLYKQFKESIIYGSYKNRY